MKIAISAESTIDLPKELLDKYDIKVLPFQVSVGDKSFYDGEMSTEDMFKEVERTKTLPKTSAHNQFGYTEFFEKLLNDYDAVIHIALSGGITSSTKNAFDAAAEMKNVYVVDSRSLSTGIALSAIYARKLTETMDDPKAIAEKVQKRTEAVQASFIIERLDYLYKGGRCSGFQLLGSNILKIRPRIVLKDGKMVSDKKYRGDMAFAVARYTDDLLKEFNNPDKSLVFITFTSATPEMIANARTKLEEQGFTNIIETYAGTTIASHCGAHTIGVLYFNDGLSTL